MATSVVPVVRRGSCLCQAVKFEIKGDPFTFKICHCINCRKATGTSFMSNGFFSKEQVQVIQGEETIKTYSDKDTTSGIPLNRHFCGNCGSNVLLSSADEEKKKQFIIVALGTLDDDFEWRPRGEVFENQKRPWVTGIQIQPKKAKAKL